MTKRLVRVGLLLLLSSMAAESVHGQSLYLAEGEYAIEAGVGWSVGPASNGIETLVALGMGGRVDAGVGISRYTLTFDDGSESTFREYAPFVRAFPFKEEQGAPVSISVGAQVFVGDYGPTDSGRYVQLSTIVYKQLRLSERFELQPFGGFAFVAESYAFGGGPAERAQYLTRDVGLHLTTGSHRPWFLKMTLVEQSFRQETYRGARVAFIRRL
jgi:hypothetical protein